MTKEKALAKFIILLNHFEELVVESRIGSTADDDYWDFEDYSEAVKAVRELQDEYPDMDWEIKDTYEMVQRNQRENPRGIFRHELARMPKQLRRHF